MQCDITLDALFADTAMVFPLKMYGIIAKVGSCHSKQPQSPTAHCPREQPHFSENGIYYYSDLIFYSFYSQHSFNSWHF